MAVILSVTFPHRRYHATPWDQAANSGVVEWPPSPWRIVRALIAVAHTRHPDVPMERVLDAVRPMAEPPTYYVPPVRRGHTRHYMPKVTQRTGENFTQLTFDSYVSISTEDQLVIAWEDAQLPDDLLALLRDLVASLPYLGRADSAVVASIVDAAPNPDDWVGAVWRESPHGLQRLMCPIPGATLEQLEVTVHEMRRGRRLLPVGSRWVSYEEVVGLPPPIKPTVHRGHGVEVMRWRFASPAPFRAVNALLATDRLRMIALSVTKPKDERKDVTIADRQPTAVSERDGALLSGHQAEARTQHRHAHWLWTEEAGMVLDLILWVPARDDDGEVGISYDAAARVAAVVGAIGLHPREMGDYVPTGFVAGDLNLTGWGGNDVMSDLITGPDGRRGGRVWTSATPHLLVRRGKRNQTLASLALEDVRSELSFRFDTPPVVKSVTIETRPVEARLYRRLRWGAMLSQTLAKGALHERVPAWIRVEFEDSVEGPLSLGGLSHFGFGRLKPVE